MYRLNTLTSSGKNGSCKAGYLERTKLKPDSSSAFPMKKSSARWLESASRPPIDFLKGAIFIRVDWPFMQFMPRRFQVR